MTGPDGYDERVTWQPERPRFRPVRLILAWIVGAAAVYVAAAIVPGVDLGETGGAFLVAAVIAVLNAILPPIVAALRLPFMLGLGFLLVLVVDALVLVIAAEHHRRRFLTVDSFWDALLAALVIAAVTVVLAVVFGTNDDDDYTLRVVQRIARRQGGGEHTDVPGILYLEIDGLALPVLRRAMRDGNAPTMARWLAGGHARARRVGDRPLVADGCEPGGDPARLERGHPGVPLGGEGDGDADGLLGARRTARRSSAGTRPGIGLLVNGGASRGNLLSGEAEEVILTVSRIEAEKRANPGYRAFFANGYNVTRSLVLFVLGGDPRDAPRRCAPRGATCARAGTAAASTR